ncbi:MAG: 30S ribosome-binding factor RbfA [Planctomycetota bacterium]|nr:30S ribosome-binding factor RbfA [Planctomycetota bacterium]
MSRKVEQLASSIHTALQDLIARGLHDPRISGLITITSVRVTMDFKEAIVLVSVLPEDRQTLVLHGLKAAAAHIRREVGDRVRTRQMPLLVFKLDDSLKKEAAVIRALEQVHREQEQRGVLADTESGSEPGDESSAGSDPDLAAPDPSTLDQSPADQTKPDRTTPESGAKTP